VIQSGRGDYAAAVSFQHIRPDELEWITRPHEPDEAVRHVAELSEIAGLAHTRANIWRYEPGAKGLSGTLSMYLGELPERVEVPAGDVIHVQPGTALQSVNHGDEDLVVFVYGTPPESEHAELLDSAV